MNKYRNRLYQELAQHGKLVKETTLDEIRERLK